jgi:hypothetical protein
MASAYAYKITEEDAEAIADLTGYDIHMLRNNLNWVVVVDHKHYYPHFYVLPRTVFEKVYPGIDYSSPHVTV